MRKKDKAYYLQMINPKKSGTKEWFLSLLDLPTQKEYEEDRMKAGLMMLRATHIRPRILKIQEAKAEIQRIHQEEENNAENYCKVTSLLETIKREEKAIESYKPFFSEPYFARMDLIDPKEGYNSYYIGKKGDVRLEIVDWRAPLARRYYQKSRIRFSINDYDYQTVLRRAIKTKEGKVEDFKNEFLSVKDYLSSEEIAGRDEEILFDPYLREIIKNRKDQAAIKDIIETIQETQYAIITCPEQTNFVLQGSAGSGKTMIMLHRLSYLMYNNDDIKARDVLMITPSASFNSFIDELSAVLELERVRTTTLHEYFLQVLANEKIYLKDRIDYTQKENEEYLAFLYSEDFKKSVQKKLDKVYDSLYGLFTGEECQEFIAVISDDCKAQIAAYEGIKNASMRVRRTVLGEIKEKKDGGLYYTKPFRGLMNKILDIQDFFCGTLKSEKAENQTYFYRQVLSFYKSAAFVARYAEPICNEAQISLDNLQVELEKEITDLKRYRQKIGGIETYIHAERIRAKEGQLQEIFSVKNKVAEIANSSYAFSDFYAYLKGEKNFVAIGKGESFADTVRFFYRETVKKYKETYRLTGAKLYPSDAYAICLICAMLGKELSPRYAFVFVDEAQDISACEYDLLKQINTRASFNIFGDLAQNITEYRGVKDWISVFPQSEIFRLDRNYRNTNQIVEFVASKVKTDMEPMGFDGPPVERISTKEINSFFRDTKGLKALICSEKDISTYRKKSYNLLSEKGKLSKSKINLMTVYESKGLEFTSVVVADKNMSDGEKYIAYTRALKKLAVLEDK